MTENPPNGARRGLSQRLFAAWYIRSDATGFDRAFAPHRRRLLADLTGTVYEIGPGAGANFDYLPAGIRWTGFEPNVFMHDKLRQTAARAGFDTAEIRTQPAEQLDVPDASADAVISTHVLCSVSDQSAVLREIWRVLKPGGRFIFIEHVAAPRGTWLRRAQTAVRPVWKALGDGCHPDRETWAIIETAGFSRVQIERFHAPLFVASPHIAGCAVK